MKPGDMIGDWKVLRTLGKGGMGMVFLCHHRADPLNVAAVKLFSAWSSDDDGFRRFERECEVLGRLSHRGIVPLKAGVVSSGRDVDAGTYWLAMEYVDGPSLEARLDNGPIPPGYAAATFSILAEALEYAHSKGVFHRDLKPANIVLGADGVRLVDFGIALQEEKTRLTAVGTFAGTLPYMPPEVVVEDRVRPDPVLGDIYALGVVLYEAVTAMRAFQTERGLSDRDRQMRILKAKMSEEVLDPGEGVPPGLRELVRRATAPRPDDRIQSWSEFRYWLEQVPFGPDTILPKPVDVEAPLEDLRGPSPVTASGYRRRVQRPARGLRLGRRPADEPTVGPDAPPTPGLRTNANPWDAPWSAEDGVDSGFTSLPGASPRDPDPTEATELPINRPINEDAPTITNMPKMAAPPPPKPPQVRVTTERPVTAASPPGAHSARVARSSPTLLPSAAELDIDDEPTPLQPSGHQVPLRPEPAKVTELPPRPPPPAAPPPAAPPKARPVAVATEGVKAVEPAPPPPRAAPQAPVATTTEQEERKRGFLLPLLALAGIFMVVTMLGGAWWWMTRMGPGEVVAAAPSAAPAVTPPAASTPAPSTDGGGAAKATPAGDGIADAWQDTGLNREPLAWQGGGAASNAQGEEPAAKAAATPGAARPAASAKAPNKQDPADAARTMKRKTFFTVDGGGSADVYVNGQRRGSAPLTLFLEPGEYELKFKGEGAEVSRDIDIASYGANEFRFEPKKRKITNIHN